MTLATAISPPAPEMVLAQVSKRGLALVQDLVFLYLSALHMPSTVLVADQRSRVSLHRKVLTLCQETWQCWKVVA